MLLAMTKSNILMRPQSVMEMIVDVVAQSPLTRLRAKRRAATLSHKGLA